MRAQLSRLIGTIPPVARRDRQVAGLRDELAQVRAELAAAEGQRRRLQARLRDAQAVAGRTRYPAFGVMLAYYRSYIRHAHDAGAHHVEPAVQMPRKLRNIALAQSHGIPTARVHRVWPTIDEIELDGLPDEFVLKADGGAGGHAVFALRRTTAGYMRLGGTDVLSEADLLHRLRKLGSKARPPYFAEDLLPAVPGQGAVPEDVKVYAFYGEAAQVMLVRVPDTERRHATATRAYIDPGTGTALGPVLAGGAVDPTIPTPQHLREIVEAAAHLSRAAGVAFCRVDFFDTPAGPVFGELTNAPGGLQRFVEDHDAGMGNAWLDAEVRLRLDRAAGRPHGTVWGPRAYEWHYPDSDDPRAPGSWERPTVACADWCYSPHP